MRFTFVLGAALISMSSSAFSATIDLTTQTLNGDAAVAGTDVVLTSATIRERGSVFTTAATAINAFTTFSATFEYSISSPIGGGADGLAFVVQNSAAGNAALGTGGMGMGYGGLEQSVIVEFDTWNNGASDDNSENHVGINLNGDTDSIVTADPGFDMDDVMATAWVDYDGSTLSVATSTDGIRPAANLLSTTIDLSAIVGPLAYFGFTASTGGAAGQHVISSFDLDVDTAVVPLPAGLPLLGFGMVMLGGLGLRRKS